MQLWTLSSYQNWLPEQAVRRGNVEIRWLFNGNKLIFIDIQKKSFDNKATDVTTEISFFINIFRNDI